MIAFPADCLKALQNVAEDVRPSLAAKGLEVRVGSWLDSAALKVQKPAWAQSGAVAGKPGASIFFSVWMTREGLIANRVFYNIHALHLRSFHGYALQSREFAAAFRAGFAQTQKPWPNVSVDFGPQTLMEGWIELNAERLETDVAKLVRRFIPLARTIDALLAERRKD